MKSIPYIVIGVVASLTIISASLLQPIYAAQIVQQVKLQRLEFVTVSGFAFPLCGITDIYTIDVFLRNYHFTGYSDGTYTVTSTTSVQYFTSSGQLIASSPQTQLFGTASSGNQFNVVTVCQNGQGASSNFHFGYTISDGVIKEIHLLSTS